MEQQGGDSRRITIHKPEDFAGMRRAGKLAAETLDMITAHVRPGISTGEIDQICHDFMVKRGAIPATLGYRGYTKSSCTSVNHVVCHGIPGDLVLADGDIIKIEVTDIQDGLHGESSRMYAAGE
ncbi:MAG: M24 family metallopeptidase, partial [Alphaproteobacteria bacterium]